MYRLFVCLFIGNSRLPAKSRHYKSQSVGLSNVRVKRDHPALTIPYTDWDEVAKDDLASVLARTINTNVAKNVILVIGDGMSISTVTGARMLKLQEEETTPDKTKLVWDEFEYTGLAKVGAIYIKYTIMVRYIMKAKPFVELCIYMFEITEISEII